MVNPSVTLVAERHEVVVTVIPTSASRYDVMKADRPPDYAAGASVSEHLEDVIIVQGY